MRLSIVAAFGKNREIGYENKLPWKLPDDIKHFKKLTLNHTVIMGRRTFDSMSRNPLTERSNIILTTSETSYPGCLVAHSLLQALALAQDDQEIFFIGGEIVYRESLPFCHRLYLTEINASVSADTFFPEYRKDEFILSESIYHPEDEKHKFDFSINTYERRIV